jgi:lipoprotein-anchoring transpeptidase ErfK/SrfK
MRKRPTQESLAHGHNLSRRTVIAGLPLLVAGCDNSGRLFDTFSGGEYGATQDSSYTVPAVDLSTIDRNLLRQEVDWRGSERPGSIVINVPERRLYLVEDGGRALRYAVGVGRDEALNFHGSAVIGRKEKWPRWTPTANMIAAMPRYRPYAGGMAGGLRNPLGARALYLYRDGRDTYFRVHGTNEPESIGHAVSSGCIRLFNQDIIDLYNRVPVGTHVTVVQG